MHFNEPCKNIPPYGRLFLAFLGLGLTAFGGPAMVAYIKDLSVKKNNWLDEETFKDGVVLCQAIPGATAMQTAAYVGLRARGIRGALSTYIGFGLPAFVLMLTLSFLYAKYNSLNQVSGLFRGLAVIVVAIVANATYSFGKGSIKNYKELVITMLAAILFWISVSPFLVIIGAALAGMVFFSADKSSPSFIPNQGNSNKMVYKQIALLFYYCLPCLSDFIIQTQSFSASQY